MVFFSFSKSYISLGNVSGLEDLSLFVQDIPGNLQVVKLLQEQIVDPT